MKIAMIGCGKLGMPCAEVMAQVYDIVGYDSTNVDDAVIPMTDCIADAVTGRDIIFVAVPTPHSAEYDGSKPIGLLPPKDFDYSIVKDVLAEINQHLTGSQLVVLISTVLPGTVRKHLRPLINNGKFAYNPYLIAMGSVKHDMVNPECIIIGTEDGKTSAESELLVKFYNPLMENDPIINIGTWDEAEAIKIFYNTFISTKIGLVNMIMDVAEANGNINVDVVTDALKNATNRITGPRYLTAGMGDAGACHPRDNIALRWLASEMDLGYDLFNAIMVARDCQAKKMAKKLVDLSEKHSLPIVIHGKAYKPLVSYENGSYSLLVGHFIQEMNKDVVYADPLTGDMLPPTKGVVLMAHNPTVTYGTSNSSDGNMDLYFDILPGSVILDPWRTIESMDGCTVIHYGNPRRGTG